LGAFVEGGVYTVFYLAMGVLLSGGGWFGLMEGRERLTSWHFERLVAVVVVGFGVREKKD
jgi:hypothetical protein